MGSKILEFWESSSKAKDEKKKKKYESKSE